MRYFVIKLGKTIHLVPESNVAEITINHPDSPADQPVQVLLQQSAGSPHGLPSVEELEKSLVEFPEACEIVRRDLKEP